MKYVLLVCFALCLISCGDPKPRAGSAIEYAAAATARANATLDAANAAAIDAASKQGKADALEDAARKDPTPGRIAAAVDARVDAASADAVAKALAQLSDAADKKVSDAVVKARDERVAMERADDDRNWVKLCRWIGLLATVGGFVIGGALAYFISIKQGAWLGAALVVTGQLVVFFGSTITWLPILCGGAFVAALVAWGIEHYKDIVRVEKARAEVARVTSTP